MPFKKGQSGNPNGRPKAPEREELRKALAAVEKKKNKKFLIHCIEQAYKSDAMAIAILKKLVPDMNQIEMEVDGTLIVEVVKFCEGKNTK